MAGSARRAVILRFHRYIRYVPNPIVSHWSVADCHHDGIFQLRDASKEENSLHALERGHTAVHKTRVDRERMVLLEPDSLFFLERM